MKKQVLFITHWYPNELEPHKGIFIKKHADAISEISKMTVVHFDIENCKSLLKIEYTESKNSNNLTYTLKVRSKLYKYLYFSLKFQLILFKKLCRKFDIQLDKFDIIHSNVLFPSGLIAHKLSKKTKIKQYHTEHWSKLQHFFKTNIHKKKGHKAFSNCEKITAVSPFLKSELARFADNSKLVVIPNVIDSSEFEFKAKIKQDTIRFLAIANWKSPKNPFYFLNALELLSNEFKFEMNLIGNGTQIDEIKNKNYHFKINYLGQKKSKEIPEYIQQTDFFLHGSDYETFSVVIIEALSCGTPVLTSRIGIAESVINETNGFICENDILDWKEKILKALVTKYDNQKISTQLKGQFDQKTIAKMFEDLYIN